MTKDGRQYLMTRNSRLFALVIVSMLSACAGAPKPDSQQSASTVELQADTGFTISEDSRVTDTVREDYDRAVALLQQGRHSEGITLLEQVAEAAPDLSAPRIDLGIAHHRTGELEKAASNLQQALLLNPEHPIAHNELGIVYRKQGRFEEARRSYESALAIYPGFHYARRNLAILCDLYLADLDCALMNYEAYMSAVPEDAEATMWIADLRYRLEE